MSTKSTQNYMQFSGPYMIQDANHLGTPSRPSASKAKSGARQAQQGHSGRSQSGKSSGPRQAH